MKSFNAHPSVYFLFQMNEIKSKQTKENRRISSASWIKSNVELIFDFRIRRARQYSQNKQEKRISKVKTSKKRRSRVRIARRCENTQLIALRTRKKTQPAHAIQKSVGSPHRENARRKNRTSPAKPSMPARTKGFPLGQRRGTATRVKCDDRCPGTDKSPRQAKK